jgi:crotonobetainyl-CoA:carnitine CoA-transferase CaiB-like acyl-CoA transferase
VPTGIFASRAYGGGAQAPEPLLGEHTREVLRDVLGHSDADIDALVAAGLAREATLPAGAG